MNEMGKNASNAVGAASNAVNQTATEIGKNAIAGGQLYSIKLEKLRRK